jgi:hypothetical protein
MGRAKASLATPTIRAHAGFAVGVYGLNLRLFA